MRGIALYGSERHSKALRGTLKGSERHYKAVKGTLNGSERNQGSERHCTLRK